MRINAARVCERLKELYRSGRQEDGSHSRIAYSPEDRGGRQLFADWFATLPVSHRVDEAYNMIFRLEGEEPQLPAIIVGSHLDTVPDGGRYDGALGCVAGLGLCEALTESGRRLRHPLEIVVFADEEGVRFGGGLTGSTAFSESATPLSKTDLDVWGMTRESVYGQCGLDTETMGRALRSRESVHCCLELHVEQGASLWQEGLDIGVVTGIAGVRRWMITVSGEANHAGSTLMSDRKDALVAAAAFIAALPEHVRAVGNRYTVATVGMIRVSPGSVNVIPGECVFSLELRDQEVSVMEALEQELLAELERCCEGLTYELHPTASHAPALMNEQVADSVAAAAEKLGYRSRRMPSGAFHDSLPLSAVFPTGMIFIASVAGLSHSPQEHSTQQDIASGCDVLLETVLSLDAVTELN